MAKSTKKTKKPGRQDIVVSVETRPDPDKDPDLRESPDAEDFQEFFGDGTEDIRVELYRTEPRYGPAGKRIDGFLGPLEPADNIESIRVLYGGGRYRLVQKTCSKFTAQKHIRISGDPRLGGPPPVEDASAPDDKSPEDPIRVNVGGVEIPLTKDVEKIKEMMLYVRMLKTAFPDPPPPPDINDTLLKLAIEGRRDPDVLDQVDKMTAIFDRLKSISPDGGGSTGWLDIGSQVINAFVRYVDMAAAKRSLTAIPQLPGKPQIAAPAAGKPRGKVEAPPAAQTEPGAETVLNDQNDPEIMSYQLIAEKAASYIVQGYIAEPQQTPAETVAVLDAVVGVPEADRPGLKQYRDVLCLVAKNILANQVETTPEDIEKFVLYFDDVLDTFTSTENLKPESVDKNELPKN